MHPIKRGNSNDNEIPVERKLAKRRKQETEVVDLTEDVEDSGAEIDLVSSPHAPAAVTRNKTTKQSKSRQSSPTMLPTSVQFPPEPPHPQRRLRHPPRYPVECTQLEETLPPRRQRLRRGSHFTSATASGLPNVDNNTDNGQPQPQPRVNTRHRVHDDDNDDNDDLVPPFPRRFPRTSATTGPRSARNPGPQRWTGPGSFMEAMAEAIAAGLNYTTASNRPGSDGTTSTIPHNHHHPDPFMRSLCGDLQALQQAVAGARSGALPPHLLFSDRDFDEADYELLLSLDDRVENKHGASQDRIDGIELIRVPRGGPEPPMSCPICLEDVQGGEYLRKLPACGHTYHKTCVDRWLKTKAVCPVCRINVDGK